MKSWSKLKTLFLRRKAEAEMAEEIRLHLELQTERNLAAGMDPDEARYAAQRVFGGVEQVKERCREQRGWIWLEQTRQDLRYAIRSLVRNPGFTAAAILTLALGIGVNAALFTVYDIVALRPLPSRAPDELVEIQGRNERAHIDGRFSYPDYLDYVAGSRAFAELVAVRSFQVRLPAEASSEVDSVLEASPGVVRVQAVSGNYFAALGAEIVLGRNFTPEESGSFSGRRVVVLSHLFWQTHLHGDPNVLGKTLTAEDRAGTGRTLYTIIGVAAPEFVGQSLVPPACWVPLTAEPGRLDDRAAHLVSLVGRMHPGVNATQAKADLDAVTERLARQFPNEKRATSVRLAPAMRVFNFQGVTARGWIAGSILLFGFVLVLLLACLNVTNLLLARGVTRQHEIGVRLSLGASRSRIVRQLFTENLVLCFGGGAAGLLFALWTLQALRSVVAAMFEDFSEIRAAVSAMALGLDWRIVTFTAIVVVVAGLGAGLAPAWHGARGNLLNSLKDEGSALGRGLRPARLRHSLAIAQVAVCLTLLSANGIMAGNLLRLRGSDLGFSTERVFLAGFSVRNGTPLSPRAPIDLTRTTETLRTLPGVESACVVAKTPLRTPDENAGRLFVRIPGGSPTPELVGSNAVSAGFFDTFGVPLRAGRGFTPQEVARGAPVAVVTESVARRLWPGGAALGQTLSVSAAVSRNVAAETYRDCEVIGIAGDFRSNWIGEETQPMVLLPLPVQTPFPGIYVKLRVDSAAVFAGVVRVAEAAGIPLVFRDRLAKIVERGPLPDRMLAWLTGMLAALALVLATIGLYGVVAFAVNQRVREIGVRVALGATPGKVVRMFVREGMRRVLIGISWGLLGGVAFALLVTKVFPKGVIADDAGFRLAVFGVVTIFLAIVSFLASWLPARRAAKVDPIVTLRCE